MISILIPTYNYSVFKLVENLQQQCAKLTMVYEILVIDDASSNTNISAENKKINTLPNCNFLGLKENIGRSKIRNLLAEKAKYGWLLFLDADTFPSSSEFIKNYIASFSEERSVIFGGIKYPNNNLKSESLRHTYGVERESLPLKDRLKHPYRSFITMAFAIKKEVFNLIQFNEKLAGYGYEDSVFAFELKENNISIFHIDNPVLHLNLESNLDFLKKSELALQNLLNFYEKSTINANSVKILKVYLQLKNANLLWSMRLFFKVFKTAMLKNLNSTKPSLFLFDLYRLGYLSTLTPPNA